jgi:hypothetical protein
MDEKHDETTNLETHLARLEANSKDPKTKSPYENNTDTTRKSDRPN